MYLDLNQLTCISLIIHIFWNLWPLLLLHMLLQNFLCDISDESNRSRRYVNYWKNIFHIPVLIWDWWYENLEKPATACHTDIIRSFWRYVSLQLLCQILWNIHGYDESHIFEIINALDYRKRRHGMSFINSIIVKGNISTNFPWIEKKG